MSQHGTSIFQCVSDAVRYIVHQRGHRVMNYVDDFFGVGTPRDACHAYDALYSVLKTLGLTISAKKLIAPATKAVCLGVVFDTEKEEISIPDEKMTQIIQNVEAWRSKSFCSRRQLQSLLGHLLYVHKCVKPARFFVNRMLDLLRSNYDQEKIKITQEFKHDLRWFSRFLQTYNGVSIYDHPPANHTIELDACLTGLGGRWDNFVYFLAIERGFKNMTIVHLEMVNIVVALKVFGPMWKGKRVVGRCDNDAVVKVLSKGRARDPFLAACARNVWLLTADADIDASFVHVLGKNNQVADLLSRWTGSVSDQEKLLYFVQRPVWVHVDTQM